MSWLTRIGVVLAVVLLVVVGAAIRLLGSYEDPAVDPAWGASAAGGMEYPTLFTCGTSMFTRARMHRPESVTVHEAGHQFWYGLVGNNEYERRGR